MSIPELLGASNPIGSPFYRTPSGFQSAGYSTQSQYSSSIEGMAPEELDFIYFYFDLVDELTNYRYTHTTKTALNILGNAVKENLYTGLTTPIEIEDQKSQKLVDEFLEETDLVSRLFREIESFIYYGSINYAFNYDTKELCYLAYPFAAVQVYDTEKAGFVDSLVRNENGVITNELDEGFKVLSISTSDLEINKFIGRDPNTVGSFPKYGSAVQNIGKNNTLVKSIFYSGHPIYWGMNQQIKDHAIKEVLMNSLSMRHMIRAEMLTMSFEKLTNHEDAHDYARRFEQQINDRNDLAYAHTQKFNPTLLSRHIINNTRVFPDYNGILSGISQIPDLEQNERLERIRAEIEDSRNAVFNSLGIPIDFIEGAGMTRFEAMKSNERFRSKILHYLTSIGDSVADLVIQYLMYHNIEIMRDDIKLNFVDKTSQLSIYQNEKFDELNNALSTYSQLVETGEELVKKGIISKEDFAEFLRDKFTSIDPSFVSKFDFSQIKDGDEDGGGGRGRY